jgi:hypothetical protein
LYSADDFKESLKIFKNNIKKNFKSKIDWYDFNILLVLRKS